MLEAYRLDLQIFRRASTLLLLLLFLLDLQGLFTSDHGRCDKIVRRFEDMEDLGDGQEDGNETTNA